MIKTIIIHEIHDKTRPVGCLLSKSIISSVDILATWTPFPVRFVTRNFSVSFLRFSTWCDLRYFEMCKNVTSWTVLILSFWLKTAKPRYWMKKPNHVTLLMGNSVVTNTWPSSSLNLKLNWQGCLQIKCQFNFKRLRFYNGLNNITRH